MKIRHQLVADYGYSLSDIDRMYPFELDVTQMVIQSMRDK